MQYTPTDVRWPARMQQLDMEPIILLDAYNPSGMRQAVSEIIPSPENGAFFRFFSSNKYGRISASNKTDDNTNPLRKYCLLNLNMVDIQELKTSRLKGLGFQHQKRRLSLLKNGC